MRDTHLRDLIAVAETGSVRGAARRLAISEAAVSKNLAALEREAGVPLVLRSSRGAELTEHGRLVLRHARIIRDEMQKLDDELARARGQEGTRGVTVCLSSTAEALLLPRAVAQYRAASPDVPLNILSGSPSTAFTALREGRLDFAVTPVPPNLAGPDVESQRLISTDMVAVARQGHPQANATHLREVSNCEWIVGARQSQIDAALGQAFVAQGLAAPTSPIQRDSFNALLHLVVNSDMLALASRPTVEELHRAGVLAILPLDLGLPPMVQYLVTASTRPLGPHARALADEFRKASRAHRR